MTIIRYLIVSILIIFSSSVFGETYYCNKKSSSAVFFDSDSKKDFIRNYVASDNIYKLEIDIESKNLYFTELDNSDLIFRIEYDIHSNLDGIDKNKITGTVTTHFANTITSLYFENDKESNQVSLIQTTINSTQINTIKRYKCSLEE